MARFLMSKGSKKRHNGIKAQWHKGKSIKPLSRYTVAEASVYKVRFCAFTPFYYLCDGFY
jgi:Mor family transcriptional regulator